MVDLDFPFLDVNGVCATSVPCLVIQCLSSVPSAEATAGQLVLSGPAVGTGGVLFIPICCLALGGCSLVYPPPHLEFINASPFPTDLPNSCKLLM